MTVGAIGLPRMRTSIQLMRLFSPDTPVIPMTRWLEEKLGATVPLEVVIRFRPESRTTMLDRMRLVAAMDAAVRRVPGATGCLSAATFAPPLVTESGRQGILPSSLLEALLQGRRGLLRANGWLAEEGDLEAWRISLRIRGVDDLDYEALARTIRRSIEPLLASQLGADRRGVDLMITGTAPIVFKARRSLLNGMLIGLGTDIALIVVGMLLLTRSWLTGAVMLLVGVFPTAVVFGSMGLLGFVVDIGSVMTPCVALGVTVDDVIHFLLCHRRGARRGLSATDATLLAYDTCGRAIFQSWGIIGVGLSAFALSSFVPTFRFGFLMFLLLTAGMLADLLLLPALLAGPRPPDRRDERPTTGRTGGGSSAVPGMTLWDRRRLVMIGRMKPPLFVRPLTDEERAALRAGLRSPDAFTLRRCQILLASAEGLRPAQIADRLGCASQTRPQRHPRLRTPRASPASARSRTGPSRPAPSWTTPACERLRALLHRSPRDFGKPTSSGRWPWPPRSPSPRASPPRLVSDETIRQALMRLGVGWKRAKTWITSPDPAYLRKKRRATG